MHSDIADLSRVGDYLYLIDAEKTKTHPPIIGISERTYWVDHRQPESRPNQKSDTADSYQNCWEVDFCRTLIQYLIEQQGYTMGDITIITPYNGQLALLHSELKMMCPVRLTEEDRLALVDQGFLSEDDLLLESATSSVELSSMLRIMTIENFQGDESNIIIFSAVRSNDKNSTGFLSIRNRINVACSRARNGFYILGNAKLLSKVDQWRRIIEDFKRKKRIGFALPIQCFRHPSYRFAVSEPRQFARTSMSRNVRNLPLCTENRNTNDSADVIPLTCTVMGA
jgi:superfamily I DNA and/or RNA helicase